jgi:hypothetical protein
MFKKHHKEVDKIGDDQPPEERLENRQNPADPGQNIFNPGKDKEKEDAAEDQEGKADGLLGKILFESFFHKIVSFENLDLIIQWQRKIVYPFLEKYDIIDTEIMYLYGSFICRILQHITFLVSKF